MIMKKFILLLAFVAVSITSNAQTWIGGNIGFDYQSAEGTSQTEIGFDLMGRYDLSQHFAIGLEVGEAISSSEGTRTNTLSVSPFIRYNCAKIGNGKFFLQASGGYGIMNVENYGESAKIWAFGLTPGFSLPLSDKAEFEVGLGGFSWGKASVYRESVSTTRFSLLTNIAIGFAFRL